MPQKTQKTEQCYGESVKWNSPKKENLHKRVDFIEQITEDAISATTDVIKAWLNMFVPTKLHIVFFTNMPLLT